MQESYIPKASSGEYCDGINLCSVRKTSEGNAKIGIKDLTGTIREEILEDIINSDTYEGKDIIRVYSSGHVFLSDNQKNVYLVTTKKDGKIQHQFTGGSPKEEENKNVIYKNNGVYKFDIEKVRNIARIRTKIRTGVDVIEEFNETPIVDWVLIEKDNDGKSYYKLVCLMHFVVKKYEGILSFTAKEEVVGGDWYKIDNLSNIKDVAPNVSIVCKEVLEILG